MTPDTKALSELVEASDWRPISTAPDDGTWFEARTLGGQVRTVHYADKYDRFPISGVPGEMWNTKPVAWRPLQPEALSDLVEARREPS